MNEKLTNAQIPMELKPTNIASDFPLEELDLSSHINSPLKKAGLETVQDILDRLSRSEDALTEINGISDGRLKIIQKRLMEKGYLGYESVEELEKNGSEQRFTFIVRLTVDERGRPLRGELEHGQSGDKKPFSGLDRQRLADFMESTIQSSIVQKAKSPKKIVPEKTETPIPETMPLVPETTLSISDLYLFNAAGDEMSGQVFPSDGDCWVQVHFLLEGEGAADLAARRVPCDIKVYARPMASESANVQVTHRLNLDEGLFEYSPKIQMSGLVPGVYSFITLIALQTPTPIGGFLEGPTFEAVRDRLLSIKPTLMKNEPLV